MSPLALGGGWQSKAQGGALPGPAFLSLVKMIAHYQYDNVSIPQAGVLTHARHATMSTGGFDRSHCYHELSDLEEALAEHLRHALRDGAPSWLDGDGDDGWGLLGGYGERVRRVREAIAGSEELALRNLSRKLGQVDLAQIWPLLREVCHDIALYVGGAALTGGAIGGGLGFFFGGGVGAAPGAIAGSAAGVEIGAMLLGFLGLKSLIEYMLDSVPRAADAYRRGLKHAWGHVPQYDVMERGMTLAAGDFDDHGVFAARQDIAEGHEIIVMALLTAIVAYLTRGKGDPGALLAEVRRSPRLGPKMAGWLEQNAERLRKHPMLQTGNNGGGPAGKGNGQATPTRQAQLAGPPQKTGGAMPKALRSTGQMLGKSEGGPGIWRVSPKRSGGAAYQEQIANVQRGIEYEVPLPGASGGKVSFDGYDAERKVLLEAKDWKGFPPKDADFWETKTLKQAISQIRAANGLPVEWHFSKQESIGAVQNLFEKNDINGVSLVHTPKN